MAGKVRLEFRCFSKNIKSWILAQKRTKTIIWMKFCMRCELSPKSWRNFPRVSFRRTFAGDLTRLGQGQYFIAFERFKYPRAIPKRSPDSSRVIVIVPSDEKEGKKKKKYQALIQPTRIIEFALRKCPKPKSDAKIYWHKWHYFTKEVWTEFANDRLFYFLRTFLGVRKICLV